MDRDNRNSIHNPQFHSLQRCGLGSEFETFHPQEERRRSLERLSANFWDHQGLGSGRAAGIKDIGSGRLFIVKPYGLARYDKQTGQDPKFPLTGGVDIKYGLTSNLVLNLTGNTDFADTEVDLEPFNLTPFKVFIPEKRQFFLENAGVFNFSLGDQDQLFFSRQI